jgi:phosphotransferase system HPr-like phosphotransfer protein
MAFTQQQYEDLVAAIAEGVTTVASNGRQVSYRSLSEMMKLKAVMEEELGVSGAGRQRRYASFRRD